MLQCFMRGGNRVFAGLLCAIITFSGAALVPAPASAQTAKQDASAGRQAYAAGDFASALRLSQRACEAGDGEGCTILGVVYARGTGVTRDRARANALYQRGCDAGHGVGCAVLGSHYRAGVGVARDVSVGNELIRKALRLAPEDPGVQSIARETGIR
jgi:TPR repeat protein